MKKTVLSLFCLTILILSACKSGPYKDGCYSGKSQAGYDYEPYIGYVTIHIKHGWPVSADFKIVDTLKNEVFSEKYEKYFESNEHCINQCRNDWKGIQAYPAYFIKGKGIENVDAISGATWSYNFFKCATQDALKNAKK